MILVDTCGWLEYLTDGVNSKYFSKQIESTSDLLIPTIIIYEVFKKILSEAGEDRALEVAAYMQTGKVVEFDMDSSLMAAKISHEFKIPMADSIILSTGYKFNAEIYTQDKHFTKVPDYFKVRYFEK